MKNAYAVSSASRQLIKVCEQMDTLAMGVQDTEQGIGDLAEVYTDLLFDELEHAQMLILKLTELVSQSQDGGTENTDGADGSAFGPGDLDSNKKGEGDGPEEGADAK